MDTPPSIPERKRIAVIAVHGVADQKPNESNAAIASMLVQHGERPGTAHGRYLPFVSHELHLPQFPVIPPPDERVEILRQSGGVERAAEHKSRRHSRWQMRSNRDYIRNTEDALKAPRDARKLYVRAADAGPEPEDPSDAAGELGYQFMRMQLRDHQPDGSASTYVTTVLRSLRRGGPGVPADTDTPPESGHRPPDEREVDVYEVYWADLSRPAQGALNFFSTAYQLLLHVATLGRQAVDDTALDYVSWPWRAIRRIQQLAVILLTLPIPLLNLILLVVGFGVIPAGTIARYERGPIIAVCAVLGVFGALVSYRWMREHVPDRPLVWSLLPLAGAAAGVVLGVALGAAIGLVLAELPGFAARKHKGLGAAISVAWWLVGCGITYWVAAKYQRLRAGALPVAMVSYALSAVVFAWWMFAYRQMEVVERLELATLLTMQLIFAFLRVCWFLLAVSAALLTLFWFVARWDAKRDPRRNRRSDLKDDPRWSRCRAALRTGRLAIGLSSGTFLLFTLLAWAGIFAFTVDRFHVFSRTTVEAAGKHYTRLSPLLLPDAAEMRGLDRVLAKRDMEKLRDAAADTAVKRDAKADAAAMAGAKRDAAKFTVPEYFQGLIATSITPVAPISAVPMAAALLLLLWMALPSVKAEGNAKAECTNPQSRQMGRWLSRGLDSTRSVTHLIYSGLLIPLVYGVLVKVAVKLEWKPILDFHDKLALMTYGAAGLAGTLIAASAVVIFSFLAKFGGSALDVVLDVDNYLRTTPPEATPRARICQRYVSLLRHVAGAEGDTRYDGVVIVAHSLGALISADLLRFLQRERALGGDPALAPLGFDGGNGRGQIPIALITMGSPLRQLLSRFFPHRYQWVRANPDNGAAPLPSLASDEPDAALRSSTPDARWLGVRRWMNVYRSGDYVGRSLWLMEWYHRTLGGAAGGGYHLPFFTSTARHGDVEVSEGCIGAGAHTHYWDMTAPDVSDRIDALIATS
jgi:hypothetical protein